MWDSIERRKVNLKMNGDISELKTGLAVLTERVETHIEYVKKLGDNMVKMNDRCILHLSNNKIFTDHLEEHRQSKSIWRDRKFQIFMTVTGFAWTLVIVYLNRINKELYARPNSIIETNKR